MVGGGGTPLGARKSIRISPHAFTLQPGERILFSTDGLLESIPCDHEHSQFDLLEAYLQERPLKPLLEACDDILDNHPFVATKAALPDDFTIVMIERRPPELDPGRPETT